MAARQTHLEVFGDETPTAVLFDYDHRDLLGNAVCTVIPLDELQQIEKKNA